MMDKKSANGLSSKGPESGGQRKQLPYSVETPYGFHLDLDFLKYVDDIEKGNTIKRVHIQRKTRGPKYSTLPRNFSLPGHGARPAAKDIWSNTSTLGSKPKSRVTEVQQIFDFRPSDGGGGGIQSPPAPRSAVQSGAYPSSRKSLDEVQILPPQKRQQEQQQVLDVRPSLFRASSMPVNVPHRKGSTDSTPEQSQKLFQATEGTDRRGSIPQDRASLHQQITAALKRVRELEEQVRTIPELKAQICSLREENERLLERVRSRPGDTGLPEEPGSGSGESEEGREMPGTGTQQEASHLYGDKDKIKTTFLESMPERQVEAKNVAEQEPAPSVVSVPVILIEKAESPDSDDSEKTLEESDRESKDAEKPSESEMETSSGGKAELPEVAEFSESQEKSREAEEKPKQDRMTIEELQEEVSSLEDRLSQAGCELERTSSLLLVQLEINRQKEITIQDLSGKIKEPSALEEDQIPPQSEPVITCDAAVNTDIKDVSEKEVLTDMEPQTVDGPAGISQTCCGTQTDVLETMEAGASAQVTTAEKSASAGVEMSDKAVETDVPEESGDGADEDGPEARRTEDGAEDEDEEDRLDEEGLCEKVAEEYVMVEKTEDIFGSPSDEPSETPVGPSETPVGSSPTLPEPPDGGSIQTLVPEPAKAGGALPHQEQKDQKQHQGQDNPTQPPRPAEASASPAAIGQVVTRIQGLLNEQWASLGSGSQEPKGESTQKQPVSKISTIQSHLRGSLSALSAFYSPVQKGGAAKQSGLKSIMKKNDCPDQQGKSGAKKNLKFVGVNGGYESTSSESSGEENEDDSKEEKEEEKEEEMEEVKEEEKEEVKEEEKEEEERGATSGEHAGEAGEAVMGWSEGFLEPEDAQGGAEDEEQSDRDLVDKNFMAACQYLKDRMAEVSTPNKEMRQVLMVLYQEWFRVSSQKESRADTVTLYLREVGYRTPTLLRYIVNLADGNGNMALHYSVSHSNFHVVRLLLDTGLCEVNHQNKAGYTAIMLAALTAAEGPEDVEVARQLLSMGSIDARAGQSGQTALMLAVSHGRTSMVQVLLDCRADMNVQDQDGCTALMLACEHGHTDIVRLLLDRPECDSNLTDQNGLTALCVALKKSHTEMVELLRAHVEDSDPSLASLL